MKLEQHVRQHTARLDRAIKDAKEAIFDANIARENIVAAQAKTLEVLAIAESIGVTIVGIGVKHKDLGNEEWPFGLSGNIFTPKDNKGPNGWPAAWHIAEAAHISHGAGNSGQHQIADGSVVDGLYRLKDGKWHREDVEA